MLSSDEVAGESDSSSAAVDWAGRVSGPDDGDSLPAGDMCTDKERELDVDDEVAAFDWTGDTSCIRDACGVSALSSTCVRRSACAVYSGGEVHSVCVVSSA